MLAGRQPAEPHRPERHPLERGDRMADRLAHAPHLALAALVDRELDVVGGELANLRRGGEPVLELDAGSIVSCIFTLTEDLDAEFPAVAARHIGLSRVPLLCAREIPVPGALPRVIRVLMHCYPPVGVDPQHVYLGEARKLRLDLEGAQ